MSETESRGLEEGRTLPAIHTASGAKNPPIHAPPPTLPNTHSPSQANGPVHPTIAPHSSSLSSSSSDTKKEEEVDIEKQSESNDTISHTRASVEREYQELGAEGHDKNFGEKREDGCGDNVVDFEGENDTLNARNWSSRKKWGNIGVIAGITFLTYVFSLPEPLLPNSLRCFFFVNMA